MKADDEKMKKKNHSGYINIAHVQTNLIWIVGFGYGE